MGLKKLLLQWVRPLFYLYENLRWPGLTRKNRKLKDSCKGQACIFLLTGSQLKSWDLGRLAGQKLFGLNFLFYHPGYSKIPMEVYLHSAPFRILNDPGKASLHSGQGTLFEAQVPGHDQASRHQRGKVFCHVSLADEVKQRGLFGQQEVFYLKPAGRTPKEGPVALDLTKRIHFYEGGIFTLFAIAFYLGFSEIYVAGAGYTLSPTQFGHFYDKPEDIAKTALGGQVALDPLHLQVEAQAQALGVTIYNVTPPGHSALVYQPITEEAFFAKMEKRPS
ncbi:MAG: hypothetical protein A2600_10730 [Candidatus Lambdaproteobacteria bacterium RIFOXYD1_FULL_56_27]|uniref:Uncharacterized protein n=1 Tax=Candidatus Lambdaproteobacteria bacterium RIFOXYD2_FULL_56_26 TaxID=1817773 RepID=A0A1F6GVA4_9PROT|nr:MAG: hypothetical protein A2426_01550 [Candidatus Lambdaproteobacteria bacterium RIFOXYC1_FULL_56_13]OGH02054.1 MAG: hypothetical protein A2557_10450 [Candidatus Lambdaproteobacteria bacterium RIFOXYD2_FULL_56_26]OGH07704.1 MAG: hypothetical protein A2600_10730 [Candidatus Lambdaproteobacteria bacterium RIFOXYD1_FULL_56_27]